MMMMMMMAMATVMSSIMNWSLLLYTKPIYITHTNTHPNTQSGNHSSSVIGPRFSLLATNSLAQWTLMPPPPPPLSLSFFSFIFVRHLSESNRAISLLLSEAYLLYLTILLFCKREAQGIIFLVAEEESRSSSRSKVNDWKQKQTTERN